MNKALSNPKLIITLISRLKNVFSLLLSFELPGTKIITANTPPRFICIFIYPVGVIQYAWLLIKHLSPS